MHYLTETDILSLHSTIMEKSGGSHGVRDAGLLKSIVERPKASFGGNQQYSTIYEKAAALMEGLVRYHVFVDGNKRTAMVTASAFLHKNGHELTATNREFVDFTVRVAVDKLEIKEIALWLEKNSEKQS